MLRLRKNNILPIALLLSIAAGCGPAPIGEAEAAEGLRIAAPAAPITEPKTTQTAVFAGGCFWGVEGVFEHVKGVISVESGYAGGTASKASYDQVSTGTTGNAESVRIRYNPAIVSYNALLQIFFSVAHDPTQLNRQGPDTGSQYRTAIFPANAAQRAAAKAYIAQLDKAGYWKKKIVTKIEGYSFVAAEAHHQNFMKNNPTNGYIVQFDAPKVANLKRLFPTRYKA